jgi:hypothetical protein
VGEACSATRARKKHLRERDRRSNEDLCHAMNGGHMGQPVQIMVTMVWWPWAHGLVKAQARARGTPGGPPLSHSPLATGQRCGCLAIPEPKRLSQADNDRQHEQPHHTVRTRTMALTVTAAKTGTAVTTKTTMEQQPTTIATVYKRDSIKPFIADNRQWESGTWCYGFISIPSTCLSLPTCDSRLASRISWVIAPACNASNLHPDRDNPPHPFHSRPPTSTLSFGSQLCICRGGSSRP